MKNEISFGNIILANTGKRGVLLPDENGNYRINSGAFNAKNYHGINYPANDYILEQMKDNSDLQRRVQLGMCYMEEEHPEPYNYVYKNGICYKEEMTSLLQWITRLHNFDRDRICGVISKIFFLPDDPNDLSKPIWNEILAKPLVEYNSGKRFKENLDTPEANTAISIRTQINVYDPSTKQKDVVHWASYDWVKEPGYIHANKHMSAGCENFFDPNGAESNLKTFKTKDVIAILEKGIGEAANDEMALKRYGGMEALDHYKRSLETIKQTYERGTKMTIGSNVTFESIFR